MSALGLQPPCASAWPQTIVKGYKQCASCHTTASGGTAPNDYGRAMSADWMTTWSHPYDEKEFFVKSSEFVDFRVNYRHLFLTTPEQGVVQFPMLADTNIALHLNPYLSGEIGMGFYGRDRNFESRLSFINLKLFKKVAIRSGFFIPNWGINTNDHSLQIKQGASLGRGSETYNVEVYSGYAKIEVFYTAASSAFKISSDEEQNFYHLLTPDEERTHWLKAGFTGLYKTVVGINYKGISENDIFGIYLKSAPFSQPWYLLAEYDYFRLTGNDLAYLRFGFFKKGFDGFIEYDHSVSKFYVTQKLWLGLDWHFRPHFKISLKFDVLNNGNFQGQYFNWL